jgi:hypothetical protein
MELELSRKATMPAVPFATDGLPVASPVAKKIQKIALFANFSGIRRTFAKLPQIEKSPRAAMN